MYLKGLRQKRVSKQWLGKKLFPPKVDERLCKKCGLPYQNGPLPKHVKDFISGNVCALVYPGSGWNRMTVKVGRWRADGRFYLSENFPPEELKDLVKAVAAAHRYIQTENARKQRFHRRRTG
ncbi:MAG: hypothetical protein O3A00_05265 [Planctomycetota bacterium]|nr:hypothetical protein [Planctomycetota bacterium]